MPIPIIASAIGKVAGAAKKVGKAAKAAQEKGKKAGIKGGGGKSGSKLPFDFLSPPEATAPQRMGQKQMLPRRTLTTRDKF